MDSETKSITEVSRYVYRIFMYDFDSIFMNSTSKKDSLFYLMNLFFFCSSFILTLVLIEMLVAFMCDTFDRVLGEEKAAKNFERA
jgi:glycopeptide antibiotics resistance protein